MGFSFMLANNQLAATHCQALAIPQCLWLGVGTMQMGCIDMGVGPTDACMLPMTP